jgi:hypothetical protein
MRKITTSEAVLAVRARRTAHPASAMASDMGVSARAVATALRPAVRDGRVSIRFIRGIGHYRFHRLTAKGGAA